MLNATYYVLAVAECFNAFQGNKAASMILRGGLTVPSLKNKNKQKKKKHDAKVGK
jgi:hypothetical protein